MIIEELLVCEVICDMLVKYIVLGDWFKVDDYVVCFIEDGVMEVEYCDLVFCFCYEGCSVILVW